MWMMTRVSQQTTPTGRLKRPSNKQVCHAWESITKDVIVKSFKKTRISNKLGWTEIEVIYEKSEDSNADDALQNPFIYYNE